MESTSPPSLQYRHWRRVEQSPGTPLNIMTYNLLADSLLEATFKKEHIEEHPELFCWKERAPRIFKEIEHLQPDLVFLQEYDIQEGILRDLLSSTEYVMLVKGKTGGKADGLAMLYKQEKFSLLDRLDIELSAGAEDPQLDRDNVAQVVALLDAQQQIVIAANCHLLFNRRRGDIKLWQVQLIQSAIDRLVLKHKEHDKVVFWAGDFNSAPSGLLYLYMHRLQARLNISHPSQIGATENNLFRKYQDLSALHRHLRQARSLFQTKKGFGNSSSFMDAYILEEISPNLLKAKNVSEGGKIKISNADVVTKKIRYQSCVALFNGYQEGMASEMGFTQKSNTDIGTVDYIWSALLPRGQTSSPEELEGGLHVHSLLDAPCPEQFWQNGSFQLRVPDRVFPSDHLPVLVGLTFLF